MNQKHKSLFILLVFIVLSYWAYPIVHGYLSAYYIPAFSKIPRDLFRGNSCLFITVASSLCSVFCAFILAFPMGYFTQYRPFLMGILLSLSACLINFIQYPDLVIQFQWFVAIIRLGEYLSLILSSCIFSYMGFKLATYNNNILAKELLHTNKYSIVKGVVAFFIYILILFLVLNKSFIWSYIVIISIPLFFTIYSLGISFFKRKNLYV